jgi:hypothetical protein
VAEDSRSKTPGRWAPFERGEKPCRRTESLGAPASVFFGSLKKKEREGHEEGRGFFEDPAEENLGGAKAQEGKDLDFRLKKSGVQRVPLVP